MASRRGPDNSVRLAMSGNLRAQNWANVFHAQLTTSSSISQADLDAWSTSFAAAYKTDFQSQLGTDVNVTACKAILYTPGGGELISNPAIVTWAGTGGATSLMGSVSSVLSWLSGVYWRGGKPRTYLPGTPGGFISAGTDNLTGAAKTSLSAAAVAFRTAVNALTSGTITGTTFGFVSFFSGNALRGTPLFYAITGATVHTRVGSQRRRDGKWLN